MECHLHFKHAQPNMCHSPKVEDGVENKLLNFLDPFFLENFYLRILKCHIS